MRNSLDKKKYVEGEFTKKEFEAVKKALK